MESPKSPDVKFDFSRFTERMDSWKLKMSPDLSKLKFTADFSKLRASTMRIKELTPLKLILERTMSTPDSNHAGLKSGLLGAGLSSMVSSPTMAGNGSISGGSDDGKQASNSGDALTTAESETGSISLKSSDVGPEQEYLLTELETSDSGSIGLVLRAIYDGGDVHKCLRALEKKIRHYDREIEKLCNFHYSGFIEAVRELLDLKTECRQLSVDIATVDHYIHQNSRSLMEKAKEIVKQRKMQANIASALENVSLCLPVLEKYTKLQQQMEQGKYYPALKTLEQLEHTYLPRIERYRFAQKMMQNIGEIRKNIRDKSFSEFTDFLEGIRKVSARIGEVALRHASEQRHAGGEANFARKRIFGDNNLPDVDADGAKAIDGASGDDSHEDISAQDMVDFSPVYRCCHIFAVLGQKETFEQYYRKQRQDQAALLLRAPERTKDPLDGFEAYFHEMIGFFVVEDHVMQTAPGLVTRSYRDQLWNVSVAHAEKTLNNHFGQCTEASVMLRIKELIIAFALTMKGYGFRVSTLYKVLQNFRDQYNEILMGRCCNEFDRILRTDNYAPMVIENEKEFRQLCERFPLCRKVAVSVASENGPTTGPTSAYPKRLPFSQFVPVVYEQAQQFVTGCLEFMSDLGMSQGDVDDTVRRSTNLLLERFSGHLKRYLVEELKSSSLVQLIQITINMGYLEISCDYLEAYIAKSTGSAMSAGHIAKLKQDLYREARSEVEQQIDKSMRDKVEEILGLAQYTWDLPESSGRASGFIMDLIAFLQTTFVSFTNLPPVLARHICMQSCKYLSSRLLDFLMDPDVKQISSGALEQFNLDVIQCELFTAQCPVPGLEDGTLVMTFADLRQLLDLFMISDWPVYLADFGREGSRYVRVHPQTAVRLLEKVVENERKKNSFFGKGKDKAKKELLDTVLKRLKALAANGATHG